MSQGYRVSTGRGGAGNMHFSNEKISSPKIIPEGSQTPNILSPVYSTGRGGAGNMRKNIDPTITRKAQDVGDVPVPHHHHHHLNNNNNKNNNNKKLNKHTDKDKDRDKDLSSKNPDVSYMDTIENTITDLDVANEPFIASLENNTMEPLNSRHSQFLYQITRTHTRNSNEEEEDAIIIDEEDYIAPITNEDLFEDNNNNNNISKVTNVLSKIRSHISPVTSSNKDTINQQEKVKFMNTDPKQHHYRSGNGTKLRLVKTISHSKDGSPKTITLKKSRRKSSHGGNKSPPPIVIGRGGAGNIVSPINTNSNHNPNVSVSNSNKKKSSFSSPSSSLSKDKNNSNNNIPSQNKEKKGFLSYIMNIFA
ncbi:hypothetical protein RI543_002458 [Arxiozyma heterogenica]|uniref:Uncharacterized protein n=1 Tax=Arxiozyma heterogenica TaxID=278026 RepID=A0AAN7WKA8_9SACH|nr:hypothetical protein RI543_002458 [Kazachstania heterogenica]